MPKKSNFITDSEVPNGHYFDTFGNGVNRKISKENLFSQIQEESLQTYYYDSEDDLKAADLEADPDNPIYVRVAPAWRLYRITSQAPVAPFDIALDNGATATLDRLENLRAATVDDMKNIPFLKEGDFVKTLGYTTPGDGGGSNYEIVAAGTGVDDDGSFIDLPGSGLQAKNLFPGGVVNIVQFGAVSDGVSDNLAALNAAIAYTSNNGLWLSGISRGRLFGVSGNWTIPSNSRIKDLSLVQLDPTGSASRRTITSSSAEKLQLHRVTVDINGDGTNGSTTEYAGIWLVGGSEHIFEDVEVTGDAIGKGLFLADADNFVINRMYVHDINYSLSTDPGDDQINGIMIQGCTNFTISGTRINDLGGDFGAGATTQYTRGIALTGCENFSIGAIKSRNVGQGVDLTGDVNSGNVNFTLTNSETVNCFSHGFKFANSANTGTIGNLTARDCGRAGFVVSGGSGGETEAWISKDVVFNNCKAINTGSNGQWPNPWGFRVEAGGTDPNTPFGVKFIGCQALDEQTTPTMFDGFRNDVPPQTGRLNECIDCESKGHTNLAFNGMHFPVMSARRTSNQTLTSEVTAIITFNSSDDDSSLMRNGSSIDIRKDGEYRIRAAAGFASNATGNRQIRILKNGSLLPGMDFERPANANDNTYLELETSALLEAGDVLEVEAQQKSGGDLDVLAPGTYLTVVRIQ